MVKKATLAQFIKQGRHDSREWRNFMPKVTGLRVKEVGSQGDVLISLDDTGWIRPTDWLANYQATIRERLHRELEVAEAVLDQQEFAGLTSQQAKRTEDFYPKEHVKEKVVMTATDKTKSAYARAIEIIRYLLKTRAMEDLLPLIDRLIRENPRSTGC